ncbi:MAG: HNH endonuclease, partial [Albidovulum sp.]
MLYPVSNIRITKTKSGGTIATKVGTLHVDGLGSVRVVTDSNGLAAERTTYRPYGEEVAILQPLTLPETKGFIGERFDDTSGLQYLNARYYDPKLAMFIQPDWWEVMKPGVGTNRYSYSFDDPVNGLDASGNKRIKLPWSGVSADIYDAAKITISKRNMKLAGSPHPKTEVSFEKQGFPDFSKHVYNGVDASGKKISSDVNIGKLTGNRKLDEQLANARAGLAKTPDGYTWHHHQDLGRMQLVEEGVHAATGHTGGVGIFRRAAAAAAAAASGIIDASAADWVDAIGGLVMSPLIDPSTLGEEFVPFGSSDEWEAFEERRS